MTNLGKPLLLMSNYNSLSRVKITQNTRLISRVIISFWISDVKCGSMLCVANNFSICIRDQ